MPRDIIITPVLNGFILRVGCQQIVLKTPDELGNEIARYYKDPNKVEMQYIKEKVNNTMSCQQPPAEPLRDPNPQYAMSGAQCEAQVADGVNRAISATERTREILTRGAR